MNGWQVGRVVEVETAEAPALIFDWQVWQHTKKGRLKEIIVVDEAWRYTKTRFGNTSCRKERTPCLSS